MCTPCGNGTYADAAGATACSACVNHTFSPGASTSNLQCVCNLGFSGPDGGPCSEIPPGMFKDVYGSSAPINCTEGSFSNASGMSFCYSCAPFSDSKPGSTDKSDCYCRQGFTGRCGSNESTMLPPMTASFVTRREVVYLTLAIFNGLTTCALLLWGGSGGLFTGGKQANLLTREHPAWAHLMNSKFVDLTHSIHPQMPLWPLFAQPSFSSAVAAHSSPGAPEIVRNASSCVVCGV